MRLNDYLTLTTDGMETIIKCKCGHRICLASEHYKENLVLEETRLSEANLKVFAGPFLGQGDNPFVFRKFYCPGCFSLVNTELNLAGTEFITDIKLVNLG